MGESGAVSKCTFITWFRVKFSRQLLAAAAKQFDAVRKADMEQVSQKFAFAEKYAVLEYRKAMFPDGSK